MNYLTLYSYFGLNLNEPIAGIAFDVDLPHHLPQLNELHVLHELVVNIATKMSTK